MKMCFLAFPYKYLLSPVMREGWHETRVTGERGFPEVGGLETLVCSCSLGWIVHEQEVEETKACCGEPGELVLQIVVGLLFQGEILKCRQGGELRPDVVIGSAKQVDHQLQLVDL